MKILKQLNLDDLLFFDVETVASVPKLEQGSALWEAWAYKMKYGRDPIGGDDVAKSYDDQAALYAEFGKIVCITFGKIAKDGVLKLKTLANADEKQLLTEFAAACNAILGANKKTALCGHAIKTFDIPWIMRRCIVNDVEVPVLFDVAHLKPWEITCYDTAELWKGTGFNGASLIAIAVALNLHNPKDKLCGYETTKTFYNEADGLAQIAAYCEKDVVTVAQIIRKCRQEPLLLVEFGDIKVKQVGVLNRAFNSGELTPADEKEIVKNLNDLPEDEKEIGKEILNIVKIKQ